jgi:predicted esterase
MVLDNKTDISDWEDFLLKNPNWSEHTYLAIKARESFFNFIQYFLWKNNYSDDERYKARYETIIEWLSK